MKKYMYLLLILLLFPIMVSANSHEVMAKYEYSKNIDYSSYDFKNNELEIDIDDYKLKVTLEEYKDIKLILISPEGEARDWIQSINNASDNYYLYFEKNGKKVSIDYSIELVGLDEKNISVYDTDGKLLYNSSDSIDLNDGDIYFCFIDQEKEQINNSTYLEVDTRDLGRIMIDGAIYGDKSLVKVNKGDLLEIAVIPEYGYKIKEINYNDLDITNEIKNGFINIRIEDINLLKVTFEKLDNTGRKYNIEGKVIMNGKPLVGATVILGNNYLKAVTDKEGYYSFKDVYGEEQYIIVMVDNKIVGYTTFILNEKAKKLEYYQDDNYYTIETVNTTGDLNIDLDINEEYKIDLSNIYEIEKENNNYVLIVVITLIVIFLGIFIYIKSRKKR